MLLKHASKNSYADETSPVTFRDAKKLKMKKIGHSILNLEKRCGCSNKLVYHLWNILTIFDTFGKYLIFSTDLFGHYTFRKGILSLYSMIFPGFAIFLLYVWALLDRTDVVFKTMWVYKF